MSRSVTCIPVLFVAMALSAAPCCLSNNADAAALSCEAHVTNPHAANYAEAEIVVQTKPGAHVTGTEHVGSAHPTQQGVANSHGVAYIYFKVSFIIRREVRIVTVVAKKGAVTETCRTSFDPT
jgi:hypothetical protein